MLTAYPQTKTYFSHWPDLAVGSAPVVAHAAKVMSGVTLAVKSIDDLEKGLLELSEQHAYTMRVDPVNFKVRNNLGTQCRDLPLSASPINSATAPLCPPQILCHCMLVAVAILFPRDFTPEVHVAFDKFLCAVSLALSERYR